jgi:hypothetical protein
MSLLHGAGPNEFLSEREFKPPPRSPSNLLLLKLNGAYYDMTIALDVDILGEGGLNYSGHSDILS